MTAHAVLNLRPFSQGQNVILARRFDVNLVGGQVGIMLGYGKIVEKSRRQITDNVWEETMRIQYEDKPIEAASAVSELGIEDIDEAGGGTVLLFLGLVWFIGVTLGALVVTLL